jgi:hypothetical protein
VASKPSNRCQSSYRWQHRRWHKRCITAARARVCPRVIAARSIDSPAATLSDIYCQLKRYVTLRLSIKCIRNDRRQPSSRCRCMATAAAGIRRYRSSACGGGCGYWRGDRPLIRYPSDIHRYKGRMRNAHHRQTRSDRLTTVRAASSQGNSILYTV